MDIFPGGIPVISEIFSVPFPQNSRRRGIFEADRHRAYLELESNERAPPFAAQSERRTQGGMTGKGQLFGRGEEANAGFPVPGLNRLLAGR
jgi:hypothetical protein